MCPTCQPPEDGATPFAPPIPNEVAFYCRFFTEVSSIRDEAGRPLHEVDFRQELDGADVRRCPYSGSRHGYLMNQTALNGVIKDWKKLKAGMSALVLSVYAAERLTVGRTRTWVRSLLPMFLPLFILKGVRRRSGDTLSTEVSSLFKVMLDVPTTIDLMMVRDWNSAGTTAHDSDYSAAEIAQYAENSGILNNDDWTCAGPPRLIEEILELLRSPKSEAGVSSHIVDVLSSNEGFPEFSLMSIQQYALSQAFQTSTAYLMEQAFRRLPTGVPANQAQTGAVKLPAYELRRRILLGICSSEESTLRVVNGFLNAAAELDSLSPTGAAPFRTSLGSKMVGAISNAKSSDSARLLNDQVDIQGELRQAILAIRKAACQVIRASSEEFQTDFGFFDRHDFPTPILQALIREGI